MANAVINTLTAPDGYTAASTLQVTAFAQRFNLDVSNGAIYWQTLEVDDPNGLYTQGTWQLEVAMLPGSKSLQRPMATGIRFRAYTKAASLPAGQKQAVVTVEAVF